MHRVLITDGYWEGELCEGFSPFRTLSRAPLPPPPPGRFRISLLHSYRTIMANNRNFSNKFSIIFFHSVKHPPCLPFLPKDVTRFPPMFLITLYVRLFRQLHQFSRDIFGYYYSADPRSIGGICWCSFKPRDLKKAKTEQANRGGKKTTNLAPIPNSFH